jgi:ATP-dependent Clp protease ATP-binding subunit ClpA
VTVCQRSLFIFDEIDKLPPGVIDAIKPFLDFHEVVDEVDYRKSIFIFLSNTGGKEITKYTYRHWESGAQRLDLSYEDLEEGLNLAAFNELGGLQNADLIQKSLIDMAVPFLPLEKSHVKLCIRRELDKRKSEEKRRRDGKEEKVYESWISYTDEDISNMADKLSYWPKETNIFSVNGCKKIASVVDRFLEEDWE